MSFLRGLSAWIDLRADHRALSAARIGFFLFLFLDWGQLYLNSHISLAGGSAGANLMLLELAVMVFVILGFRTRAALIVNYALVQILDYWYILDNYHLDYALYNISFIMLFSPRPQVWSLDSYLDARRGRPRERTLLPTWFTLLFFFGIELVYFGSLFYKYDTQIWTRGLGFWFPSALPHFCTGLYPEWAEIGWLVVGASYFALFFETSFPLVLFGKLRRLFGLGCFALHLGIAVFFPIPFFGLALCGLALFFMWPRPPEDLAPPVERPWGRRLGFGLCAFLALTQVTLTASKQLRDNQTLGAMGRALALPCRLMGVYDHALYSDFHFRSEPLVRFRTEIEGREVVIPCYGEEGYPERSGRFWAISNFFLRWDLGRQEPYPVVRRFVEGWFRRRGLPLSDVRVEYKRIRYPLELDFEINDRIRQEPWREAGWLRVDSEDRLVAEWSERFAIERQGFDALLGEETAALEGRSVLRYAIEVSEGGPPRVIASGPLGRQTTVAVVAGGRVIAERALLPVAPRGYFGAVDRPRGAAFRVVERPGGAARLITPERVGRPGFAIAPRGVMRSGVQLYPIAGTAEAAAKREGGSLLLTGPCPQGAELLLVFSQGKPVLMAPARGPSFELVLERPEPASSFEVYALTRGGLAARYVTVSR